MIKTNKGKREKRAHKEGGLASLYLFYEEGSIQKIQQKIKRMREKIPRGKRYHFAGDFAAKSQRKKRKRKSSQL